MRCDLCPQREKVFTPTSSGTRIPNNKGFELQSVDSATLRRSQGEIDVLSLTPLESEDVSEYLLIRLHPELYVSPTQRETAWGGKLPVDVTPELFIPQCLAESTQYQAQTW